MNKNRYMVFVVSLLVISVIGCASYPVSNQLRKQANRDLDLSTVQKNPLQYQGETVIWGGFIVEIINNQANTEIIILETPLMATGRPEGREESEGRFIAITNRFLDPAIYYAGKKITVAGKLQGQEVRQLSNTNYTYPVVRIEQMHLWQRKQYYNYSPYEPYGPYDPYGPYAPYRPPYFPRPFIPHSREHEKHSENSEHENDEQQGASHDDYDSQ